MFVYPILNGTDRLYEPSNSETHLSCYSDPPIHLSTAVPAFTRSLLEPTSESLLLHAPSQSRSTPRSIASQDNPFQPTIPHINQRPPHNGQNLPPNSKTTRPPMPKSKPKKASPKHFPSKPYMRALHSAPPTTPPTAAWSTTDDELLLTSKTSGKKWVEISPLFPGKTSNACRKRHARLVTNAQLEWNAEREKDLAMEFVSAKVGFFKSLAGNLGLEWQQVEKKVGLSFFLSFFLSSSGVKQVPLRGVLMIHD